LPACDSLKPQHHHKQEKSSPIWGGLVRLADDLERTLAFLDVLEDETEPERRTG